jgi:thiamine transport system ATP-binding protein
MLDEPLGSLDRGLREHLLLELKTVLRRLAIPAIYVTHDQFEAFAIADRLMVMRAGRFVRAGAPGDVYGGPQTEFVARFLGFDNIIDGTSDGHRVTTAIGTWPLEVPAGPVRLLLRGEGLELTESGGVETINGQLETVAFQGMLLRVAIRAAGELLSFDLPAGTQLPAIGDAVSLHVPSAQVIETEELG